MSVIQNNFWVSFPTQFPQLGTSKNPNSQLPVLKNKHHCLRISASSGDNGVEGSSSGSSDATDRVKSAFERAKEYRKEKARQGADEDAGKLLAAEGSEEDQIQIAKVAMEKAKTYGKEKNGSLGLLNDTSIGEKEGVAEGDESFPSLDLLSLRFSEEKDRDMPAGLRPVNGLFPPSKPLEVEILVGDQSKFGSPSKPNKVQDEEQLDSYDPKISTWGALPRPVDDPFPPLATPEVEIIVGDQSKFGSCSKPRIVEDEVKSDIYKPQVSTRGGFPRTLDNAFPPLETLEVEFIVGDQSKFGSSSKRWIVEDEGKSDMYKPKVSTWRGFPSPMDDPCPPLETPEVEIIVGDQSKFGSPSMPNIVELEEVATERAKAYQKEKNENLGMGKDQGLLSDTNIGKKDDVAERDESFSSLDFLGFHLSKKKNRGIPAGLRPVEDPFAHLETLEVEIIVGDQSKFGSPSKPSVVEDKEESDKYRPKITTWGGQPMSADDPFSPSESPEVEINAGDQSNFGSPSELSTVEGEEENDTYKPKVSTWGVFPRPSNISKTYGGGRTIHPGELLEAEEVRAGKEAQTRKFLSGYRRKLGLDVDPNQRMECEKVLKEGNDLMELGKLQAAISQYEKIMNDLVFQSDLHGFAALQWSICQDSLNRFVEARVMYEKLKYHPNTQVSKKARQLVFGFQAMKMMKVRRLASSSGASSYGSYFQAFVDENQTYSPVEGKDTDDLWESLPYIIFLLSPIAFVLVLIANKGM